MAPIARSFAEPLMIDLTCVPATQNPSSPRRVCTTTMVVVTWPRTVPGPHSVKRGLRPRSDREPIWEPATCLHVSVQPFTRDG
jgi:hypothetical protein